MTGRIFNQSSYIDGILLNSGFKCSERKRLLSKFAGQWESYGFGIQQFLEYADLLSRNVELAVSQTDVEKRLLTNALLDFADAVQVDTVPNWLKSLDRYGNRDAAAILDDDCDRISNFYSDSIGMDVGTASVRLVERLPPPYEERPFSALTADEGDRRKFGIAPGVYFLQSDVRPSLCEYFLAHELVHVAIGNRYPDEPANFLEEGLAELVSIFYYYAETYGKDAARSLFSSVRRTTDPSYTLDSYGESLSIVALAAARNGLDSIVEYFLREGRNSALKHLLREFEGAQPAPKSDKSPICALSAATLPRSTAVSAAAFVCAPYALVGATVSEISHAAMMSPELVESALRDLSSISATVLRPDGQVVSASSAPDFSESGLLRFRVS